MTFLRVLVKGMEVVRLERSSTPLLLPSPFTVLLYNLSCDPGHSQSSGPEIRVKTLNDHHLETRLMGWKDEELKMKEIFCPYNK